MGEVAEKENGQPSPYYMRGHSRHLFWLLLPLLASRLLLVLYLPGAPWVSVFVALAGVGCAALIVLYGVNAVGSRLRFTLVFLGCLEFLYAAGLPAAGRISGLVAGVVVTAFVQLLYLAGWLVSFVFMLAGKELNRDTRIVSLVLIAFFALWFFGVVMNIDGIAALSLVYPPMAILFFYTISFSQQKSRSQLSIQA